MTISDFKIKKDRRTGDRYVGVQVENLIDGMRIDMGIFRSRTEAMFDGEINPRTWDILLRGGMRYTETRGAFVRVWID